MKFSEMTTEQQLELRNERYTFFEGVAENYSSFEEFLAHHDWDFAILGIELLKGEKYITICLWLDVDEYEEYYVIPGDDGQLTLSNVMLCKDVDEDEEYYFSTDDDGQLTLIKDEYCAYQYVNMVTGELAEEKDIIQ